MKRSWSEDEFKEALRNAAAAVPVRATATDLAFRGQRSQRRAATAWRSAALAAVAAVAVLVVVLRPEPSSVLPVSQTDLGDPIDAPDTTIRPAPRATAQVPAKQPRIAVDRAIIGSVASSISSDGRFVAFSTGDPGIVKGDTNRVVDIFVRDLASGTTTRASVGSRNKQSNGASREPRISGDGRFVVFSSDATNLVDDDENKATDIFLRDLASGTTTRVSVTSSGGEADGASDMPTISDDGRRIAFRSAAENLIDEDKNDLPDIFVRDLVTGTTRVVSRGADGEADGPSRRPYISGDGRSIAFSSGATNLVADDDNDLSDIFVTDLGDGSITRESLTEEGEEMAGASAWPSLSRDGSVLAFLAVMPGPEVCADDPGGPRPCRMTFVRDRTLGKTELVSRSSGGEGANGDSLSVAVSPDGRFVAFSSAASDLIENDRNRHRDVFLYRRADRSLRLLSIASDGRAANGDSGGPAISDDARVISFQSLASNLVRDDRNGHADIFVRNVETARTRRVSLEA